MKEKIGSRYAEKTTVSCDRSRAEIQRIIRRFGANDYAYGVQGGREFVAFAVGTKSVKFSLPDPTITAKRVKSSQPPTGVAIAAEERRLWRSLVMLIKSKLEIIESGISTLEIELLPYTMRADGRTVGEWMDDVEFRTAITGSGAIALPAGKR